MTGDGFPLRISIGGRRFRQAVSPQAKGGARNVAIISRAPAARSEPGESRKLMGGLVAGARETNDEGTAMRSEIERLMSTRDWSSETQRLYRYHLIDFEIWLEKKGLTYRQATAESIRAWLAGHEKWSASSSHNAICALKAFYHFTVGEAASPLQGIRVRRRLPPMGRTLSEEEVKQLLAAIDTSTAGGVRDLSILTLMLDTGLRSSEVCRLQMDRLEKEKRVLSVRVKGGDWSYRVYGQYTAACLEAWLSCRYWIAPVSCQVVYVGLRGKDAGWRFTRVGLRTLCYRWSERAGIRRFSPHALRRTFATLALKGGAPTRLVQVAGAWRDLDMVERYSRALAAEDFRAWAPTDRIMGIRG